MRDPQLSAITPSHPSAGTDRAYLVSTIQIHPSFLQQLKEEYPNDHKCKRQLEMLAYNHQLKDVDRAEPPFEISHGILYTKPNALHQQRHPVIPQALQKKPSSRTLTTSSVGHLGFARTHERVSSKFYVFGMTPALRAYLGHCHECRIRNTPRHRPYGYQITEIKIVPNRHFIDNMSCC
jgi:hypothetical protein